MASVGRKRKHDKNLPQRVYHRRGAYYFVDPAGKWHPLGKEFSAAMVAWAARCPDRKSEGTIEHLIARFEVDELPAKAEATQEGRRQEFKRIRKAFGTMLPEEIEPHHVWNYWTAGGKGEQTRHEIRALSALLTYARRVGARTRPNPCFGLQLPQSPPRDRYVTDDEFLKVRDLAQPMVGYAMDLALLAGVDLGTVLKLERRHITEEGLEFERPKKKGQETAYQLIEWSEDLRLTVKALLAERPQLRRALICNRKGQRYTPSGFKSQWQRLMRRLPKDERFHFHDLRAKSASDDETDQGAADRLGHADVKLTRRVYRRLPKRGKALSFIGQNE